MHTILVLSFDCLPLTEQLGLPLKREVFIMYCTHYNSY
jgi:hypothetical protein